MTLRHGGKFWAGLLLVMSFAASAAAAATKVDSFTDLKDGLFFDIGPFGIGPSPSPGGVVTITPGPIEPGAQFGGYGGAPAGTPADPADGNGIAYATQTYTITFSLQLAAFGLTFYHMPADNGMDYPATIRFYDGVNGTGHLLGEVTSAGYLGQWPGQPDFVGLWSDSVNIRSAQIAGNSEWRGFQVDGYGLSFTPIPEPMPLTFGFALLAASFAVRRLRGKSR